MFSFLGPLGRWLLWTVVILVVLGKFIGYHHMFASMGDAFHGIFGGSKTLIHHAKHGG